MDTIEKLSSSQGRRDEAPNQALAHEIVNKNNQQAVKELIEGLKLKSALANDCIKVLYEIGNRAPQMISPYTEVFLTQLESRNNRLQWGSMTALQTICSLDPKKIFSSLPRILDASEKGSVITKDNCFRILADLAQHPSYHENAMVFLFDQLRGAAVNQLPMYAEMALEVVDTKNKDKFTKILRTRLADIDKDSRKRRVEKVINNAEKQV